MFPHNKQFGFNERFHLTRFALVGSWLISAFRAKLKIGAVRLDKIWDQAIIDIPLSMSLMCPALSATEHVKKPLVFAC